MMKVRLCLLKSVMVVDVDERTPRVGRSLKKMVDELGDYMNVDTVPYEPVFTLRRNPRWPSKWFGIGRKPKKPQ